MHTAKGWISEIALDGRRAARISCPAALVPAPGQYLLATADGDNDSPLATPVFSAGPCPGGFHGAAPLPGAWLPGSQLSLRGPFGKGFNLPAASRFVVLAAFGGSCARVLALLEPALAQKAAVVLLADAPPGGLPADMEISPLSALGEIAPWADYFAIDIPREAVRERLSSLTQELKRGYAQVLVETPLPCAGVAQCGVCAVTMRRGYQLACKDGPVFDFKMLGIG